MPVQYDARGKGKHFLGYYWDRESKKKVSVGMFHTREEAQEAVLKAYSEKYPNTSIPQSFNKRPVKSKILRPKTEVEKKPVNLKFGLWEKDKK